MTRDEHGSAAVLVIVMLPFLVAVVCGVLQIGALRVLAARVASAADLATLAAVDDQDDATLAGTGVLRLSDDAAAVARQYFALNLEAIAGSLGVAPQVAAAGADVVAFPIAPAFDPLLSRTYDRPTVRLAAAVPVRAPVFGALLLPAVSVISVRAVSSPR